MIDDLKILWKNAKSWDIFSLMKGAKVLVTGGAGYIGSHTIVALVQAGMDVVSVDNFSNARPSVFDRIGEITGREVKNYDLDITDANQVKALFDVEKGIDCIIHFAAFKAVEESVEKPIKYYRNNITGLIHILDAVDRYGVENFVFSSSCTVYGQPDVLPVTELSPIKRAESPYGLTKQVGEQILRDYFSRQSEKRCIALRYFNPAGAHQSGKIGEQALFEAKNLVPIITETAIGKRLSMKVFGSDYDTRDGSCIRDYIHIQDLAEAHLDAMNYLLAGKSQESFEVFNLGIGEGVTVLEAIKAFEEVTGRKVPYEIADRRAGDVVAVYADYQKAKALLGWTPKRDIRNIMATAWVWEQEKSKYE